jgi:osmoprotectant transport system ATP-binding protein
MIEVKNVNKSFMKNIQAVRNVSFLVPTGQILVLAGLSGCGKTTTLKMINRLIKMDSGEISINGINIMEWDPNELRRNIGYAIQETGLLPHMTVGENVGIVPKLKRWDKEKIEETTRAMLRMVKLVPDVYATRYPQELSGGQKQRVGVARALAAGPEIVLMDEPFGALDPVTREELQEEFLSLQSELKKTIIFITHDIFEAVRMGDQIAIMKDGRIDQINYPEIILEHPQTSFVNQFIGRHREYLLKYAKNKPLPRDAV